MNITSRAYKYPDDYEAINQMIVNNYGIQSQVPLNWCQTRWEYMHFHPLMQKNDLFNKLSNCGIWEDNGKVVAVVHFEHSFGQVYFDTAKGYEFLKKEMLEYAQSNLAVRKEDGKNVLEVFINEFDKDFEKIALEQGFEKLDEGGEETSIMKITPEKLEYQVPDGFKIQSFADENDIYKFHQVLHRGFNHEGEPSEEGIEGRKRMQSAPNYDKELNIVAVDLKTGNYVAIAGSWYDAVNNFVCIEPVATDYDFRRKGLGKAVVLEAIKRSYEKGANLAFVGSGQQFYRSIGFEYFFTRHLWRKIW